MSFITRRLAAACLAAATLISPAAAQDLTDLTPARAEAGIRLPARCRTR